jgi:hypothetical protein
MLSHSHRYVFPLRLKLRWLLSQRGWRLFTSLEAGKKVVENSHCEARVFYSEILSGDKSMRMVHSDTFRVSVRS